MGADAPVRNGRGSDFLLVTRHCDAGTRRFNSSNQFNTTWICATEGACCSLGLSIRKRWPSGGFIRAARVNKRPPKQPISAISISRGMVLLADFRGRSFTVAARIVRSRMHYSLLTTHRPAGTRRFNSSNQFSTTLICVGAEVWDSTGLSIRKRWPSGLTS